MTLQVNMMKESGDFMEGNSSLYVPTLLKLIAIDTHFLNRCVIILVCHMILQHHMITWLCDFMGRSHLR